MKFFSLVLLLGVFLLPGIAIGEGVDGKVVELTPIVLAPEAASAPAPVVLNAELPALPPDQIQIQTPSDTIGYADGKVHNLAGLLTMLVGLMGSLRVVSTLLNKLALVTKSASVSTAAVALSTAVSVLAWLIGWFHLGAPSTIAKPAILPTFLVPKTDKTA
jgi:DMSO reductase anchor subunit